MQWFNIARVKKNPSKKKEPEDELVLTMHGYVLDKADLPLYNMLGYWSKINIYDRHNYFLARQYMIDMYAKDAKYNSLYAEYHLTLTDEAKKVVDALLKTQFICDISRSIYDRDRIRYICRTRHPVYIPAPINGLGRWELEMRVIDSSSFVTPLISESIMTNIPFNCGPLRPLWEKVVDECWIERLRRELRFKKHIMKIRDALLRYQYLDRSIVPRYPL
ncbi:MAG: hypothetical protein QXS96_04780 [Candidatus Caldarchaeum sp.]